MTRIALIAGATIVLGIALAIALRPGPTPLPKPVERAVRANEIATAVDSTVIHQLRADADSAKRLAAVAVTRERSAVAAAGIEHRRADSLALIATRIDVQRDTAAPRDTAADAWRKAYAARTLERDSLASALITADASRVLTERRASLIDSALRVSQAGSARKDTLIVTLTKVAESREQCRIARFIPCLSRKEVAVIAGTAGVAIAKGWIPIPIIRGR